MIGVIYILGSQRSFFGSRTKVTTYFKNVEGLQEGGHVRFSGLTIGSVRSVSIYNDSLVEVRLVIDKDLAQYVKKDAFASVDSDGLMGNKTVTISKGQANESIVDGDILASREPTSMEDIISTFKRASENANSLTEDLIVITTRIREGKGFVGRLVSDTSMANKLDNMVASIETTTQRVEGITGQMSITARKFNHGDGLLTKVLNDESWTQQTETIMDSLSTASGQLALTMRNLEKLTSQLSNEQGVLYTLTDDPKAGQDLAETFSNLNQGTTKVDDVLETINNSWLLNLFSKDKKSKKD